MKLLRLLALGLVVLSLSPSTGFAAGHGSEAKPAKAKEEHGKGGGKEHGKEGGEGGEKPKQDGLFASQDNLVPIPTIIAPVLYNDRLMAHLYIYVAALTKDASDAQVVKMRLPYVQDALVRDVNDNTLTIAAPNADPDTKPMLARFKSVINGAVGKPLVTEIQVGRVDTAPY